MNAIETPESRDQEVQTRCHSVTSSPEEMRGLYVAAHHKCRAVLLDNHLLASDVVLLACRLDEALDASAGESPEEGELATYKTRRT